MDRRKTSDVLFYALQCAKSDRESLADAWGKGCKEYDQAKADIKAFERLQVLFFGKTRTTLEAELDGMKEFSLLDMKGILKTNPELFNHGEGCQCEYCMDQEKEK